MSRDNDFNIPRFVKFMDDLENDRIPEYNNREIVRENIKNYTDMLFDDTLITVNQSLNEDKGNGAIVGFGKALFGMGFGLAGMTMRALEKTNIPFLHDRTAKRQFAKATEELFKSYKEDMYGVIQTYAKEIKAFGKDFLESIIDVLGIDTTQEQEFLKSNKRLFLDMRKEGDKYHKKLKELIPSDYRTKYSIKEYIATVKKKDRPDEFNALLKEYSKWVEKTTKEKFLPIIKDVSSYIMIEYLKQQNNEDGNNAKRKSRLGSKISRKFGIGESSRVDDIYKLVEILEIGDK